MKLKLHLHESKQLQTISKYTLYYILECLTFFQAWRLFTYHLFSPHYTLSLYFYHWVRFCIPYNSQS